jgi:hypothetical protein
MDRTHRRLAEIGLRAAERYGFALAGGYAVQAHGILERPSEDVDLFTGWDRRDEFATALGAIIAAYQESGFDVAIDQQYETFARLRVVDPSDPGQPRKVELVANWRSQPPIQMDIGPVLHVDDVAAGKMSALYTRAEPRDFLDVDAITTSRSHTRKRLCELAEQADGGFDRRMFAEVLGMLERYPDRRFAVYGATPEQITGMRARFKHWRVELLATRE